MSEAYTGEVAPGGPAAVRVLDEVVLRKLSVGSMDNNAYTVTCRRTGARLLVDAAAEADRLLELVTEDGAEGPLLVVTTHRHRDHLGALAAVLTATGASHAAGAGDAADVALLAGSTAPRPLVHGEVLTVGAVALEVVALRGHTPGSVALAYREPAGATAPGRVHLLTGDSLFPGGPGRTADPRAFDALMSDLEARVFDRFDDGTWVYPGHGRDTTLGAERPHLGEWRARGW
ncbi:MBL fold metallo-hydrolase [Cellulomonas sp. Marseille-Q8402]